MQPVLCALLLMCIYMLSHLGRDVSANSEIKTPSNFSDSEKDFERGKVLFEKGYEDLALVSLKDFIRRYPEDTRALQSRIWVGQILSRKGDLDLSEAEFRKVLKKSPANQVNLRAEATYSLGELLYKKGKYTESQIELEALLRKYPNSVMVPSARKILGELNAKQSH